MKHNKEIIKNHIYARHTPMQEIHLLLHEEACANEKFWYTDPETGKKILTAYFLKHRGYCCKSKCTHCPYNK